MTELEHYTPSTQAVDLRDRNTDSWTDVVVQVVRLAQEIAHTEFVPAGLRGSPEKTTAAILYSRELGLPPMTGLSGVHVIDGKAGISAETMRALILQAGHDFVVAEMSEARVVVKGRRRGQQEWSTASFTIGEANRAGLTRPSKSGRPSNYTLYPGDMLLARATTRLARMVFADVIHGMRSTEELTDMQWTEDVDQGSPAPQASATVSRAPRASRAQSPAPDASPKGGTGQSEDAGGVDTPALGAEREQQSPPASSATTGRTSARKRAPLRGRGRAVEGGESAPVSGDGADSPGSEAETPPAEQPAVQPAEQDTKTDTETLPADDPTDEVQDAEIVDEEPRIGVGQCAGIMAHFKRLHVEDRAERLWWTSQLAGREVTTTNNLTAGEATKVLAALERLRNRDALETLGAQLADEGGDQ